MPDLPMLLEHQRRILDGRMTLTLRYDKLEPSVYRMVAGGGESLGHVRLSQYEQVSKLAGGAVWWGAITRRDQAFIASLEGYARNASGVREFEAMCRRLRLTAFVESRKPMIAYRVEPVQGDGDD